MTIHISKSLHGHEWHCYEDDGDRMSFCGRTPETSTYQHKDLPAVTCKHCKRLLDIITRQVARAEGPVVWNVERPAGQNGLANRPAGRSRAKVAGKHRTARVISHKTPIKGKRGPGRPKKAKV